MALAKNPSNTSWQDLGNAAFRAQRILAQLEKGVQDLTAIDMDWLYKFTGYTRHTRSARTMCVDIIQAYKVQSITLKLTRQK
jgi:hypothetical protein